MTITVQDPDGGTHEFPDGTPDASINAEMQKRWAARGAPKPAPLTGPGMMPPGVAPGSMSAKPGSNLEAEMVPLSADAQRGLKMLVGGGATGNKALEQAGRMILEKDPTYQARTKQAAAMGEAAGQRQATRLAGENILSSYAKLLHTFDNTDDDTLRGAIGPYASAKYSDYVPFARGMTPPQAAVAYGGWSPFGFMSGAKDAEKSWNTQNLFSHDVHGITNALTSAAGKGVRMSDKRQEMFDSAMRDFMLATDRASARKILDHAKSIIQNDFNLTPEEADKIIADNIARFKGEAAGPAAAMTKRVRNTRTGEIETLVLDGGEWKKAP
jgi:hypothetical protein